MLVALVVAVELSLKVFDPVPESDPDCEELTPIVREAVGLADIDFDRLCVVEGVVEDVEVPLPVAELVCVLLEETVLVGDIDFEMLGVCEGLEPFD